MTESEKPKRLRAPPIVEVVCGFLFEEISFLDPVVLGEYWLERKDEFPTHQLHAPIVDEPGIVITSTPAQRVWFVSADDATVLQFQPDRMLVNWRKRSSAYPSFSGRKGEGGLRRRSREEFDRFANFVGRACGRRPIPRSIVLAKIDLFEQGPHFSLGGDLQAFLPALAPFVRMSMQEAGPPPVQVQFQELREDGLLTIGMRSGVGPNGLGQIRLETQIQAETAPERIDDAFVAANRHLNSVFRELVSWDEQLRRFGGEEDE